MSKREVGPGLRSRPTRIRLRCVKHVYRTLCLFDIRDGSSFPSRFPSTHCACRLLHRWTRFYWVNNNHILLWQWRSLACGYVGRRRRPRQTTTTNTSLHRRRRSGKCSALKSYYWMKVASPSRRSTTTVFGCIQHHARRPVCASTLQIKMVKRARVGHDE
ncbi:hypothetical protein CPC08DRAFT_120237 [Agrocybe pediades]|nr:hypothetical protein CPC08DRAFT_120237 [Agrocybe pediades]